MARSWLFVTWAGGGNVGPVLCLAEHLRARGDQVAAVAPAALGDRLAGAGIDHVVSDEAWLPVAGDVLAAVTRRSPDAVVTDYMLTDALCGAERSGLPSVALVHTLYRALLADGAPSPIGMAGPVAALNRTRAALGLAPIAAHRALLDAAALVLVTAPASLDGRGPVPANVAYAGALVQGPGPDESWVPPAGPGPLVVVCTGTAGDPTAETDLLARILEALGSLPVRGFVTVPGYLDPADLTAPGNVTVEARYVRHAAVLPHADLLVTHAGLGTVLAGLTAGVPLVCVPLDRDQPANAAAVVRLGAGVALPADAGSDALRAAVVEQLHRRGTVRLDADPRHAVMLLDRVFRTR